MATPDAHEAEYDGDTVAALELVWGEGFMAPGGAELVRKTLGGLETKGKDILDIGCGIGGGTIVLARDFAAQVVAIDLEAPLVAQTQARVSRAGLDGQVLVKQCAPGPLPFEEARFDIVYSVGAFTQTPDKPGLFAEALRVLRPGGSIVSYDWTKTQATLSAAMERWITLEELTYDLITIADQCALIRAAGFVEVMGTDDGGWYAGESQIERDRLAGPLREALVGCLGGDKAQHTLDNWDAMIAVLQSGEMTPAFFRGRKPL